MRHQPVQPDPSNQKYAVQPHFWKRDLEQWQIEMVTWLEEVFSNPMVQRILDIPTKGPIFILDARDVYAPETIDFWLRVAQSTVGRGEIWSSSQGLPRDDRMAEPEPRQSKRFRTRLP